MDPQYLLHMLGALSEDLAKQVMLLRTELDMRKEENEKPQERRAELYATTLATVAPSLEHTGKELLDKFQKYRMDVKSINMANKQSDEKLQTDIDDLSKWRNSINAKLEHSLKIDEYSKMTWYQHQSEIASQQKVRDDMLRKLNSLDEEHKKQLKAIDAQVKELNAETEIINQRKEEIKAEKEAIKSKLDPAELQKILNELPQLQAMLDQHMGIATAEDQISLHGQAVYPISHHSTTEDQNSQLDE